MSDKGDDAGVESGVLPTHAVTKEQTVILVRSLLVDWKVLDHLREQGVVEERVAMARANCCAPDGGSCCVNRGG
jgi:hypothetical protein